VVLYELGIWAAVLLKRGSKPKDEEAATS
jgi:hypothetical protein